MKAGEVLLKIKQILNSPIPKPPVHVLLEISSVVKEFYKDLPEKIWFAFYDKSEWYVNGSKTYINVFLGTDGQEYADLYSEHESMISEFLPADYSFCMEATLECPANRTEAEVIADLTGIGLHYREDLNQ